MGIMRGRRLETHPTRRSLTRMFADPQQVGRGLYIGDVEQEDRTVRHTHHHRHAPDSATPTTTTTYKENSPWREADSEAKFERGLEINSVDSDHNQNPIGKDSGELERLAGHHPSTSLFRRSSLPLTLSSSSSSSSSSLDRSLSSFYPSPTGPENAAAPSPYTVTEPPASAQAGSFVPRHNMTSQHSNSYSSRLRDLPSESIFSSSYSAPRPHTNLLNFGADPTTVLSRPPHSLLRIQTPEVSSSPYDLSWNFSKTVCLNQSTDGYDCWDLWDENDTSTASFSGLEEEYQFWKLVLIIIPLLTVFGNILVVMSIIKEKSLKTVTNYFICSLAVADILVAVVVMPVAVCMEVMNNRWLLSDGLCDAWVASDVLGCTASILNLTAICVDRFIAVTQPIKYAKHKNSKRAFIMLAITWVISVAIAAPIALGVNYSDARKPGDCQFFNSDFLIYSSMGSFYIPSMIMIFLYWKIYRVIRQRALKARKAKQMRDVDRKALQGVIENPATAATTNDTGGVYGAEATVTTGLAKMDNGRVTSYNTNKATTSRLLAADHGDDNSVTQVHSNSDDNSEDEDESPSGSGSANNNTPAAVRDRKSGGGASNVVAQVNPKLIRKAEVAELIANPVAEELERMENEERQAMLQFGKNGGCAGVQAGSASTSAAGLTCPNEAETPFTSVVCKGDTSENSEELAGSSPKNKGDDTLQRAQKKGVTKFNFHMRTSRKRKEKSSSRREKKATKTLAIVLGVFLACWVPFFTLNIVNAICIRYHIECHAEPLLVSFLQWLGYINSFLNPVIYTIFNQEFRKAFRKLLTEPCA